MYVFTLWFDLTHTHTQIQSSDRGRGSPKILDL
jgi:hypothetical protein